MDIGAKIKELRKKRGITQERLAEYLNISPQAVSKWESGISLPDITFVAPIAAFFKVSTDELLSSDRSVIDLNLRQYKKKLEELTLSYDYGGVAELCRKVLKEYPGQYEYMIRLAGTILNEKPLTPNMTEEVISLCEAVLDDCLDENLRVEAKGILAFAYSHIDRKEEALKLAETYVSFYDSKEFMTELILRHAKDKPALIKQTQSNIAMLADKMVSELIYLSSNGYMGERLTLDEKICFAQAALKIYSAIFCEGHTAKSNGRFRHIYERMSELYCCKGDKEKAIENLRLAAESAIAYDRQIGGNEKYTSMFVCDCECWHGEYSDVVRLLQLMEERKSFNFLRNEPEFVSLKERLESKVKDLSV
ncbi:MAG: helix-turn-helix domain-containing protein [Firmicutes bacterium]|nr:helix-turn-helix domain-containing protein [Bacillota bacterium]